MKTVLQGVCLAFFLLFFSSSSYAGTGASNQKITHVIIVWLKKPGDAVQRQRFVDASRKLNNLPGIINRHVGVIKSGHGHGQDTGFDVAVSVTLENQQALDTYMNSPVHQQIIKKQLAPLIRKMVTYNFSGE